MHYEMEDRQSSLLDWSHLRLVIARESLGASVEQSISYLEQISLTKRSPVLKEKLADLYWAKKKFSDAFGTYEEVLKLRPTPQQKTRVLIGLADKRSSFGLDQAACEGYEKFLQEFPEYPDPLSIYRKLLPLAQKLGKKDEAERCQREITRLTPASAAPKS